MWKNTNHAKSGGDTILYRLWRKSLVGMQTALNPSKRRESFQWDVLNLQRRCYLRTGISIIEILRALCISSLLIEIKAFIMGTGVGKCLTCSGIGNNLEWLEFWWGQVQRSKTSGSPGKYHTKKFGLDAAVRFVWAGVMPRKVEFRKKMLTGLCKKITGWWRGVWKCKCCFVVILDKG